MLMLRYDYINHDKSSISDELRESIAAKNRMLSPAERKALVDLYDSTDCRTTAMSLINAAQNGDQVITERRIKRWKKGGMFKISGRPLSVEFEEEVIKECESTQPKKSSSVNIYPYEFVRECAIIVYNKDYWDKESSSFIKKWHHDKTTCKLRFSNRWVLGLMQRVSKRRIAASLSSTGGQHDDVAPDLHPSSNGLSPQSVDQKKPSGDDAAVSMNVSTDLPIRRYSDEEMEIVALFEALYQRASLSTTSQDLK